MLATRDVPVPDDPILLFRLLVHVPPNDANNVIGLRRRLEFLVDPARVRIQSLCGVNLATHGTPREHLGLDHLPSTHTPVLHRIHALVSLDRLASNHRPRPARVALVQLIVKRRAYVREKEIGMCGFHSINRSIDRWLDTHLVALLVDGLIRVACLAGDAALLGVRVHKPVPSPETRPRLSTVDYILHTEQRRPRKLGRGVVLNCPPISHGGRRPVRPAASAVDWNVLVPHRREVIDAIYVPPEELVGERLVFKLGQEVPRVVEVRDGTRDLWRVEAVREVPVNLVPTSARDGVECDNKTRHEP